MSLVKSCLFYGYVFTNICRVMGMTEVRKTFLDFSEGWNAGSRASLIGVTSTTQWV